MLGDKNAAATIAVKDIDTAKRFYEGTLGLKPKQSVEPGVLMLESGGSLVLVYQSQFAGTNKATAATWDVGKDIEGVIRDLKAKGVAFEHYDMPGMKREGDVHRDGKTKAAWFKDPDGNILAIVQSS